MTTWTFAVRLCSVDELVDAGLFGVADGDVDGGDVRDGEEGAQRVEEDGHAVEGEELLGGWACGGHAGADTGGGENDEDRHGKVSIARQVISDRRLAIGPIWVRGGGSFRCSQ